MYQHQACSHGRSCAFVFRLRMMHGPLAVASAESRVHHRAWRCAFSSRAADRLTFTFGDQIVAVPALCFRGVARSSYIEVAAWFSDAPCGAVATRLAIIISRQIEAVPELRRTTFMHVRSSRIGA